MSLELKAVKVLTVDVIDGIKDIYRNTVTSSVISFIHHLCVLT